MVKRLCTALVLSSHAMPSNTDALPPIPSHVRHIDAVYDLAQLCAREATILPENYVYDAAGRELIASGALPDWLSVALKHPDKNIEGSMIRNGQAIEMPIKRYAEHFEVARKRDGGRLDPTDLPTHDVLIVQYWAEWCAPCILEAQAIADALETQRTDAVWLTVETDPQAAAPQCPETKSNG